MPPPHAVPGCSCRAETRSSCTCTPTAAFTWPWTRSTTPRSWPPDGYAISELGRTLVPVFDAIAGWSDAHLSQVTTARLAYDTARAEEEAWAQG